MMAVDGLSGIVQQADDRSYKINMIKKNARFSATERGVQRHSTNYYRLEDNKHEVHSNLCSYLLMTQGWLVLILK